MILHKDKATFEDAIRATSDWMGIAEIYIEKDYWVTYALKNIFESELKDKVIWFLDKSRESTNLGG